MSVTLRGHRTLPISRLLALSLLDLGTRRCQPVPELLPAHAEPFLYLDRWVLACSSCIIKHIL